MAFISYTERPISALSSVGEARAGLIWVDFNFVMSQEAPIRWSLYSWAAQANHGHPNVRSPHLSHLSVQFQLHVFAKQSFFLGNLQNDLTLTLKGRNVRTLEVSLNGDLHM